MSDKMFDKYNSSIRRSCAGSEDSTGDVTYGCLDSDSDEKYSHLESAFRKRRIIEPWDMKELLCYDEDVDDTKIATIQNVIENL